MSDTNDTNNHYGVLLEDMNHKFDVILEYLAPLVSLPDDVTQLKDDMRDVKTRLTSVEIAVTDLSKQHFRLEGNAA
jgi:uncharacterized protein YoxC